MASYSSQPGRSVLLHLVVSVGLLLGACSWTPKGEAEFDVGIKDLGVASWYGSQFHGKQAANGELFDMAWAWSWTCSRNRKGAVLLLDRN